jgi:hypothetical protein
MVVPFPVDPDIARQWVPPEFQLKITQGNATGIFVLIDGPEFSQYSTPNSPPFKEGENIAPDSVVHFWFLINGPGEISPVDGAEFTAPTAYYYDVADLVTNPVTHRLYRRAGRPAILVNSISLVDEGTTQTGEVTFLNGSKISLVASNTNPATPYYTGGNFWQFHVGGLGEMGNDLGVRLDPETGNPSNVSTTRGRYLGCRNTSTVTVTADPGTYFEDIFGISSVESKPGTFFKPNNAVLRAGRGDLEWTAPSIPRPPDYPE